MLSIGEVTAAFRLRDESASGVTSAASNLAVLKEEIKKNDAQVQQLASSLVSLGQNAGNMAGDLAERTFKVVGEQLNQATERSAELKAQLADMTPDKGSGGGGLLGWLGSVGDSFVARVAEGVLLRDAIRDIIRTAEDAVTGASAFLDMSRATGISIEDIQRFNYIAPEFGVSMDQMVRGVEMFSAKLANGDPNVRMAVDAVGLSVKDLIAVGPKEAFLEFAEAAGRLADPMDKDGVMTEAMGRAGKALVPVLGQLRDAMADVPKDAIISDANVQKAKELDTWWKQLIIDVKAYVVEAANAANTGLNKLFGTKEDNRRAMLTMNGQLESGFVGPLPPTDFQSAPEGYSFNGPLLPDGATSDTISNAQKIKNEIQGLINDAMVPLNAQQKQWVAQANAADIGAGEIAKALMVPAAAVERYVKALQENKRETEAFAQAEANLQTILDSEDWDGTIEGALKMGASIKDLSVYFGTSESSVRQAKSAMDDYAKVLRIEAPESLELTTSELRKLGDAIPESFFTDTAKVIDSMQKIESGFAKGGLEVDKFGKTVKPSMDDLNATLDKTERSAIAISNAFADFPRILEAAFTGGGGLGGAVKALSETVSNNLFGKNGPLSNITSGLISSVSEATSGLGQVVSSTLGSIAGSVLPGLGGLLASGIGALFNIGGPSQQELDGRKTSADFVTNVLTPLLSAQEKIEAGNKEWAVSNIAIRDAYTALGFTATDAIAKSNALTQQMLAAEKQGPDAVKAIQDQMSTVLQDQNDLNAAIKQYGFTIDELGPAMQKQQLTQQAETLENQWRLLVGSGIDVNLVTTKMSSALNDYLKLAMQTGQEVPAEMQPIVQKMIDMGTLTDANGNKITSLSASGLTFSETMTQGFDRVVNELEKVFNKLGLLPAAAQQAANQIPPNPFQNWAPPNVPGVDFNNVTFQTPQIPGVARGGLVTTTGISYFDAGGFARGTDTVPAMLTPGEMILNAGQQRAVFGSGDQSAAMLSELRALGSFLRTLPGTIARANRDAALIANA